MTPPLSAKLMTVVLVLSTTCAGYIITSSRADIGGVNGQVAIDGAVIIRQGNGVNYSFSNDAYLTRLEVKASSIELNDWLEIGSSTTAGYLNNSLIEWTEDAVRWTASATNSSAVLTYNVSGLLGTHVYQVRHDGAAILLTEGPNITFSTIGNGTFEILVWYDTQVSGLVLLVYLLMVIGVVVCTIGAAVGPMSDPNTSPERRIGILLAIVIAIVMLGVIYQAAFGG